MGKAKSAKVRIALIGTGGIAGEHVKGFLAHEATAECVAMVDVSEAALNQRRKQYGREVAVFSDWREMLAKMGDQIDAVDICLPHHLHAAAILDCARAGKHILCEKPMCMNLSEADSIGSALVASGVTYMSAHNQLFMPAVVEARRRLDAGQLGRLFHVRSQDCFWANWGEDGDPFKGSWRASKATQGGGVLIDTGYHPTYRLLHLGGAVASVRGTMSRFRQKIEGEDTAAVQVRFKSGAMGEILTSWAFNVPHGTHQIHLVGEAGELYGSGETLFWLERGKKEPEVSELAPVNTFEVQIGHFVECLQTGRRPVHGYEEGREVLRIITEATASAAGW